MHHTYEGPPEATTRRIEELVRGRLAQRVGADVADSIPATEKFYDVGIDSLDIVLTLAELERDCGVARIADGELWDIADSVGTLVAYLSEHATVIPEEA